MALPGRRHFDIESAAEYLGCSVSDLNYYLDEGMLRFAFYITEDWMPLDAFAHDDLSQELQTKMYRLPDLPDDHDFKKIKRKAPEKSSCPGFLYVSGYHRRLALEKMNADGARIYYFETLNGESINIWEWGSLSYALSHLREDGELSGTVLPREELDRFAPEAKAKGKAKPNEKTVEPKRVYAVPLGKPPEQSFIIVKYANQFFWESGEHPKLNAFGKYLQVHAGGEGFRIRSSEEMAASTKRHEREEYDFNGYGMTAKSLDRALKTYRIKD